MIDQNNDLKANQQRIAAAIKRVQCSEFELIMRLKSNFNPVVFKYLEGAIVALKEIKRHYSDVLFVLLEIKEFYPSEHGKIIANKIEGTQGAISGTDQALATVEGLIEALRLAPTRFFSREKGGETK